MVHSAVVIAKLERSVTNPSTLPQPKDCLPSGKKIGMMEPLLPTLSSAVLRSAWVEPDAIVRGTMWQPLLTFLKGMSCRF
jgi:hypothetical protein